MTPSSSGPRILVERMMYRTSIAVAGESAASYALLKLIPVGAGSGGMSVGLNLALVLDVSGSMYEEDGTSISRLKRIQHAAKAALSKLRPQDTLSIVAFAHNCQTLLPPTPLSNKAEIEKVIDQIDMYDVDPGGTSMDQGILAGLEEVKKNHGQGRLSQLIVLTDGETSGEAQCRRYAEQAGGEKIALTMIGVGTEWNSGLIKDLARLGTGQWHYIDVSSATAADDIFVKEFEHLASVGFTNVELHFRPKKDIKVKRIRMVTPQIKLLTTTEPEERHLIAALGTLEKDNASRYIVDLSLPKRPDGKFSIADLEVTFDSGAGVRQTSGASSLEVTYTSAAQGHVNAEVAKYIDEIQLNEMNENLQQAIAKDDQAAVVRVAEQIEKKAEVMGQRAAKKTMLARQVLNEVNQGGKVSKKTQLAVDDAMRAAQD
jgi:Ca-activated chloride channel family protein